MERVVVSPSLIIVERELPIARAVLRVIEAVGGRAILHGALEDALEDPVASGACVLAACGHLIEALDGGLPLDRPGSLCVVGHGRSAREHIARLLGLPTCEHLVLSPAASFTDELALMTASLLRGPRFRLEDYLAPSLVEQSEALEDFDQRGEAVAHMGRFLAAHGQDRRMVVRAQTVVEELVCNALMHLPADVAPAVRLRYATDGRRIGFAVSDSAGALEAKTIRTSLRRCCCAGPDQMHLGGNGAGLGLFMAHQNADQLVFNLLSGSRTEVIGLIDTVRSRREPQVAGSIHIYDRGHRGGSLEAQP